MARIYKNRVSVYSNTKGQLVVKADPDGKFSHENVAELHQTMAQLSKRHNLECRFFQPESGGDTPVLLTDRWGKPYVALLKAAKAPGPCTTTRPAVQKLA